MNDAGELTQALCGGVTCEPGSQQLCFSPDECPSGYICDYFRGTPTRVCFPLDAGLSDAPGDAPDVLVDP
jgi:hypothetical protein